MNDTGFHAADAGRLAIVCESRDGRFVLTDPPDGQWAHPPLFADGSGGLVSSVDDLVACGRMLMRGGSPVLSLQVTAEMTRDQLIAAQPAYLWPGFSFLEDRGWATACPCSTMAATPGRAG